MLATPASSEPSQDTLRADVKVGVESDSNALREDGTETQKDTLSRYFLKLDSRHALSRGHALNMKLLSGGKVYRSITEENTLLNQASARYVLYPLAQIQERPWWFVTTNASFKDRTEDGHKRDYTRGSGGIGTGFALGPLSLSGGGGYTIFAYKPNGNQSSSGPNANLSLNVSIKDTWLFNLGYSALLKDYNAGIVVRRDDGSPALDNRTDRKDVTTAISTGLTYQGSFVVGVGVSFVDNTSNSYGQSLKRLSGSIDVTTPLVWEVLLSARASLQRTFYSDEIFVDDVLAVDEDNRNVLILALERPIYENIRGETRYALYTQEFGLDSADYNRQLLFFGVGVEY